MARLQSRRPNQAQRILPISKVKNINIEFERNPTREEVRGVPWRLQMLRTVLDERDYVALNVANLQQQDRCGFFT